MTALYKINDRVEVRIPRDVAFANAPDGKYSDNKQPNMVKTLFGVVDVEPEDLRSQEEINEGAPERWAYTLRHWVSEEEPEERQAWNKKTVENRWPETMLVYAGEDG